MASYLEPMCAPDAIRHREFMDIHTARQILAFTSNSSRKELHRACVRRTGGGHPDGGGSEVGFHEAHESLLRPPGVQRTTTQVWLNNGAKSPASRTAMGNSQEYQGPHSPLSPVLLEPSMASRVWTPCQLEYGSLLTFTSRPHLGGAHMCGFGTLSALMRGIRDAVSSNHWVLAMMWLRTKCRPSRASRHAR